MKFQKLGVVLGLFLALAPAAQAMERAFGWSRILSTGAPAPTATVTVRNAGTATLSTIFSDNLSTPKANPFTADSVGYWFFYSANGRYDISFSGGGIVTPYTLSDFVILDSTAVGSICGVSGSGISFVIGSTGTDFNLDCNDGTDTITFNLPSASATNRGVVTTGAQTFAGAKTFSTPIAAGSGGTGVNGSAAANGRLLIGNGTGYTLANLTAGAFGGLSITNGAGSITLDTIQDLTTTGNPNFNTIGADLAGNVGHILFANITNGGALVFNGTGQSSVVELNDGQILVGTSGGSAAPSAASVGAAPGISVSAGPGSLTIGNAYSLNGLTATSFPTQTFAVGTSGSDFGISSAGGVHTFSIPDASLTARGFVSPTAQTFEGPKSFNSTIIPLASIAGLVTTGTDASVASNWAMIPSLGTGTGTTGTLTIFAGHKQVSGTTAHQSSILEQWQGGTVADPVTDEISVSSTHGSKWVRGVMEELLTLSTVGATTNTASNLLPADAIIEAVTTRVTTTISGGGVANFSIGDSTTAARFSASTTGLTAGSTRVGIAHWSGAVSTLATGPSQAAAASVRITCDATPTAGVIRITVFYRRFVAPTS